MCDTPTTKEALKSNDTVLRWFEGQEYTTSPQRLIQLDSIKREIRNKHFI